MKKKSENNSFAIVALTLGIVSLILSFIPFVNVLSFFGGVVAIIFGIIALSKYQSKGMSISGLALSVLALIIMVFVDMLVFKDIYTEATREENLEKFDRVLQNAEKYNEIENREDIDANLDRAQEIIDSLR